MIAIDGKNIRTEWTLEPVNGGLYNEIMKFPSIKDRDTNDWTDRNGIQVDLTDAVYKHREMTLQFFCDTYSMYKAFIAYLKANQNVSLFDSRTDRTYTVEYMNCSSFQYCRNYNTFAIKVRECDPTVRGFLYIISQTGLNIISQTGAKLRT